MRINFDEKTDISVLQKYSEGKEPMYGRKGSTSRGIAWCKNPHCEGCVGHLMLLRNNMIVGFIDTECRCGQKINWSTAETHI